MSERLHTVTAPFRRLRWQLILSYTIVTIGALMVAVLIMAALLFSRLFLPDDLYTPADWQQATEENVVPLVRPFLASQAATNSEVVSELLNQARIIMLGRPIFQVGDLDINTSISAEIRIILVDETGNVLAFSDDQILPGVQPGQPLDGNGMPGLAQPLSAALAGETDPDRLFVALNPGDALFVTPILDEPGSGQILGAAIIDYSALPTQRDVLSNALAAAGRAFLFFVVGAGLLGTVFGSITAGGLVRRFERISLTSDAWSRGDLAARIDDEDADEIGQLAGKLDAMAARLEALLRQRQEMAVAEERNRLARDLHDSAKQQAFAASAQMGAALALQERDPAQAREHLLEAQKLVDRVRKELTDLILKLRPAGLEDGGLPVALRELAVDWAQQNDIEVEVQVSGDGRLSLEVDQALYRISQEALANTARHSGATRAGIELAYGDQQVNLTISDDGRGFDPTAGHSGLGLRSMRERVELIGGKLQIDSAPDQGSRVTVTWRAVGQDPFEEETPGG